MDKYINNNFSLCQQLLIWGQTAKSYVQMMAIGDQKKVSSPLKGPIVQVVITLKAILAKT